MTFAYRHTYDDILRLTQSHLKLNGQDEFLLNQLDYDTEDRVAAKYLHSNDEGANFLQVIHYGYDNVGRLRAINGFDELEGSDVCSNHLRCFPTDCDFTLDVEVPRDGSSAGRIEQIEATTDGNRSFVLPLNYPYDLQVVYDGGYDARTGAPLGNPSIDDDGLKADLAAWYQQNAYFYDKIDLEFLENQGPSYARLSVVGSEVGLLTANENIAISAGDCCESEVENIVGTTGGGQTVHYSPDLFGMTLDYNGLDIQDFYWQTACGHKQQYHITYDALHRLVHAAHTTYDPSVANPIEGRYDEIISKYDAIGNIERLTRNGMIGMDETTGVYQYGQIDNLTYGYANDRLQNISDDVSNSMAQPKGFQPLNRTYAYDQNGNMIYDSSKDLAILYNHLNLPRLMQFGGQGNIEFTYTADGAKQKKVVSDSEGYEQVYAGMGEYKDGNLEAVYFGEGRVTLQTDEETEETTTRLEYVLKDHLGNTRVMFSDLNEDGLVDATEILHSLPRNLGENHYYPFGLNMEGEWCAPTNGVENLYQYNGKELNVDFGLGWNDYPEQSGQVGARWYDASVGRFTSIDPMAEDMVAWGGYSYVFNNPLSYNDPTGMFPNLTGMVYTEAYQGMQAQHKAESEQAEAEHRANQKQNKPQQEQTSQKESNPHNVDPITNENVECIDDVCWGETRGLYPTKNMNPKNSELYNPEKWDKDKTKELLEARAGIKFIAEERNPDVEKASPDLSHPLEKKLASYHMTDNFPDVASVIKNNPNVTHFAIWESPTKPHGGIDEHHHEKVVKSYGPFYNVGGGDAPLGPVYINFYSATPKK